MQQRVAEHPDAERFTRFTVNDEKVSVAGTARVHVSCTRSLSMLHLLNAVHDSIPLLFSLQAL